MLQVIFVTWWLPFCTGALIQGNQRPKVLFRGFSIKQKQTYIYICIYIYAIYIYIYICMHRYMGASENRGVPFLGGPFEGILLHLGNERGNPPSPPPPPPAILADAQIRMHMV